MAKYNGIETEIWEELLEYTPRVKLLYIYLFSCPQCRPSGLYKIKIKTIRTYTGCGEDDLKKICGKLIEYDFDTSEVFVRGKFKRILPGFTTNDNMRKAVRSDFNGISSNNLKCSFYSKYEGALRGLVDPLLPLHLPLPKKEIPVDNKKIRPTTFEGGYEEIKKKAAILAEKNG